MDTLNRLRRWVRHLVQQGQTLFQAAGVARERRRRQPALDALEAERLDRIREPWKYQGKP